MKVIATREQLRIYPSLKFFFLMAVSLVIWDENPKSVKKIDDCFIHQSIIYWVHPIIYWVPSNSASGDFRTMLH